MTTQTQARVSHWLGDSHLVMGRADYPETDEAIVQAFRIRDEAEATYRGQAPVVVRIGHEPELPTSKRSRSPWWLAAAPAALGLVLAVVMAVMSL